MHAEARPPDGASHGVAVVVVNYRTMRLTEAAVRSVLTDPVVEEVVVVDNASGDGSAEFLRSAFAQHSVRVVESPENMGFGRGVNLGVSAARAPFVFLLNSDAEVQPGTISLLLRALTADPAVGVVAPAIYDADRTTLQSRAYGPLPPANALLRLHRGRRSHQRAGEEVGWVSGAAMMLRRSDFLGMGGFHPEFKMYLEDVDLCRRLREIGKTVVREPQGAVVHLLGGSSTDRLSTLDEYHRSKVVYLRRAGAGAFQVRCAAALRIARLGGERVRAGWRRSGG
jgi:N-acetylglucosaminyl-diphospho-decaprenol L-rhamnosyltransferase